MRLLALLFALSCACGSPATTPVPDALPEPVAVAPGPELPPPPPPAPPEPPKLTPAELKLPTDPAELAARLLLAEDTVRDLTHTDEAVVDSWGHLQQRIYRAMAKDVAVRDAVLAQVPEARRDLVAKNAEATALGIGTIPRPKKDLPAWTIGVSPPVDQLLAWYKEAEAATKTPWTLLAAVHLIETRMGKLQGISYAGARGPMQFMPETWKHWGKGNIDDPRDAIFAAGRYLAGMGAPKDLKKALWHYNQSQRYVDAVFIWHEIIAADPASFRGYHGWQVYYLTPRGSVWLPEGYSRTETIPVDVWCAESADRCQ